MRAQLAQPLSRLGDVGPIVALIHQTLQGGAAR